MLLLFYLIFFKTIYFVSSDIIFKDATCSTTNVYQNYTVDEDIVMRFRSPDFPATMYKNYLNCNAHFQAANNLMRLMLLLFNGATGPLTISDGNNINQNTVLDNIDTTYIWFASSDNNLFFNFANGSLPSWTAFEAIVYPYYKYNRMCPFSNQTIKLEKDVVIPISDGFGKSASSFKCQWIFVTNPDQILKVVMKFAYQYANAALNIVIDGDYIDTLYDVDPSRPKAYYYRSINGIFTLIYDYRSSSEALNFIASISVVDDATRIVNDIYDNNSTECESDINGILTTISMLNYTHGYPDYANCYFPLEVSQNTEIVLHVDEIFVEKNVDILKLSIKPGYIKKLSADETYFFSQNENGRMLNFTADGNTKQAGFKVTKTELDCQCSPSSIIIPCEGSAKITTIQNTEYYCGNQNCTFYIIPSTNCSKDYFMLDFSLNLDDTGTIQLYSDNHLTDIFKYSFKVKRIYSVKSNISINFYSTPSSPYNYNSDPTKLWSSNAMFHESPNYLPRLEITDSQPYTLKILKDLKENDAFVVCSANSTDTLELFLSGNYDSQINYMLFDSNVAENYIASLNFFSNSDTFYPPHVTSSSGCFTLLNTKNISTTDVAFFRIQKAHAKNCIDLNNVFQVGYSDSYNFNYSANDNGKCRITLLTITPDYQIIKFKYIKTSSADIYQILSTLNEKQYFAINSTDSNFSNGATIYNFAVDIIIPNSQKIDLAPFLPKTIVINLDQAEQHGSLASPSYGGLQTIYNETQILYILQKDVNIYVEFFVKNIAGDALVILQNSNTNITLHSNQTITEYGSNFTIFYQQKNPLTDYFLIEYSTIAQTPNITLSSDNLNYHIFSLNNFKENIFFVICSADDEDIEMYIPDVYGLSDYILYDCKGFCNKVGTLNEIVNASNLNNTPSHVSSTSKCFTILNRGSGIRDQTLLFRIKNTQSEYCASNNIFQTPKYGRRFSIDATAAYNNNDRNCEIFIFARNNFVSIESISSNGVTDNYIFKIPTNGNVLMEINNTEAGLWKNVLIYTNVLSITLRKQISIKFYEVEQNRNYRLKFSNFPAQNGIFTSPCYGDSTSYNDGSYPLYQISSDNNDTTAFLNFKSKNNGCNMVLNVDSKSYTISENIIVNGKNFSIYFIGQSSDCFVIEYTFALTESYTAINLNEDNPEHVLWLNDMNEFDMITVCTSSDADKLQLSITQSLNNFLLYDGVESLGNLKVAGFMQSYMNVPKTITSKSGCFTLHKIDDSLTYATGYFSIKKDQTQKCNIFQPQSSPEVITALAPLDNPCEMIILASQNYFISVLSFNTSGMDDTVSFQSTITHNLLAEIKGNETDFWKNLYFYTPALSVIIPKGQNVFLELGSVNQNSVIIDKLKDGQKGILASPTYNGVKNVSSYPIESFSFYNPYPNCGINFQVIYLSQNGCVTMKSNTTSHSFSSNDSNIIVYDNFIEIGVSNNNCDNTSFLIYYKIENCNFQSTQTYTILSSTTSKTQSGPNAAKVLIISPFTIFTYVLVILNF